MYQMCSIYNVLQCLVNQGLIHVRVIRNTFEPVFKDHRWEGNNIVFVYGWFLIAWSFMQKTSNWEIKNVVALDRAWLYKSGL